MVSDGCRKCMQREISDRLTNEGYNCFICKSKWKSTPEIPSGILLSDKMTLLSRSTEIQPKRTKSALTLICLLFFILKGEYTYIEVMTNASSEKGEMKVIIELNFRGEFEMARVNEGYNRLVEKLPEVYVGKIERLRNLIKILCCASKKCMKEKKMHMAPWRKHKYMQAKYLGSPEIKSETIFPVNYLRRLPRPSGSMLTFDLLDSLTPAIKVI